jgi:hypothetical protein
VEEAYKYMQTRGTPIGIIRMDNERENLAVEKKLKKGMGLMLDMFLLIA